MRSRPTLVLAVGLLVILLAAAAAVFALFGNPLELLSAGFTPALPRVEQRWLPAPGHAVTDAGRDSDVRSAAADAGIVFGPDWHL